VRPAIVNRLWRFEIRGRPQAMWAGLADRAKCLVYVLRVAVVGRWIRMDMCMIG
jgi:hypothetical protein